MPKYRAYITMEYVVEVEAEYAEQAEAIAWKEADRYVRDLPSGTVMDIAVSYLRS